MLSHIVPSLKERTAPHVLDSDLNLCIKQQDYINGAFQVRVGLRFIAQAVDSHEPGSKSHTDCLFEGY